MSDSMLVRASRDGDQFHYLWAARRALHLLNPQSGLVAITVEGPSTNEIEGGQVEVGEALIDIAEYFGDVAIEKAALVRYVQLKHSTLRAAEAWQPSGLEKSISGFADRYRALRGRLPPAPLHERLEFWFVTNRPISAQFVEAVEDAATQRDPRHPADLDKLKKFASLDGADLALFCSMLRFEGRVDDYWTQRNILSQDVSGYLPVLDVDAPTRLKELVNRKALSESSTNPSITKMDVLRALQTDETDLFPAPCMIEPTRDIVPREQETALVETIVGAAGKPVVVHADAGVGKSIFSTRIGISLPPGSVSIVYDCFGNGQYRSASGYRHRHRTALVQIANELSSLGLSHPLIPTTSADTSAFMRAFLHRITQAICILRARNANAVLALVVDAADNAEMAANEINDPHSFIRDLLREALPEGVRVIALCRPHRVQLLNPPPHALLVGLEAFSKKETAAHLRQRFPDATDHDVYEFHRLSSRNPRVQALALSRNAPLPEILRLLGPNPTTVESAIGSILEQSIAKLRDTAGEVEREQIDLICAGLAALRPLIPLSVLASMSGVDEAAIKSFALDLGRPLIVNGDTIQFFDEPAETWFRDKFRPGAESIKGFVARLGTLASASAYVASALPQLMLEAGQFSELVELALTSSWLPETSPVERRDVELQRLQFALKAALRIGRYTDAAKLALKAGGESAGDDRQRRLLQDNTDLAALFLDSNGVQEVVSRRTFGSGWVGSHHVYEAALLSGHRELLGEARSRLRMAEEWLRNWAKLPPKERDHETVSHEDRAVMAMAHFNVHGASAAAHSLRVWRPRELSYSAGRILARRFLDHGRYEDVDALARAADNDLGLILAVAKETRNLNRLLPKEAAERGFRLLANPRINIEDSEPQGESVLSAVVAMVETAYRYGLCDVGGGLSLLERYLPNTPPRDLASRFSGLRPHYMRAYALRAALAEAPLRLEDLATPELRKEMEAENRYSTSRDLREFKENIGTLLPWYSLWARAFRGPLASAELSQAITDAKAASAKAEDSYSEEFSTADEIANIWLDILLEANSVDKASIGAIISWSQSLKRQLFTPTLNRLTRLCAQEGAVQDLAFEFAQTAFALLRDERSDAQNKVEGYVDIARSVLTVSRAEAEAYFSQAVEVASKIGEENLARWDALIDLAERAGRADRPSAEIAYKFARCAEVTWDYVVRDKHFAWSATVAALSGLCPASCLAIISRWRDRRFGNDGRVLALAIEALLSNGSVSPLDALPLVAFRADWDENKLLDAALPLCSERTDKIAVLDLVYRYMKFGSPSAEKWRRLEASAASAGLVLPGIEDRIAEAEESARRADRLSRHGMKANEPQVERNWDGVFAQCDLTTPNGISVAHKRFRAGDPPFYSEILFREAARRVPVGSEAEFVKAFGNVDEFDLFALRAFLESFPSEWRNRLSVRASLAAVIKDFCQRFCMEIRRNRYYEVMPIKLACQLTGLTEAEVLDVILAGIGESMDDAGPDRLFSLVGLISHKLSSDDALDALSYGLDLFGSVLEQTDGDGSWDEKLSPPAAIEDSIAGYIWAGLASPDTATRWEAAHVVVALCALRRTRVLAGLFHHASVNTASPFSDVRLVHYGLHAQQWLLIATARAALEHVAPLAPHVNHFLMQAATDQPHVLIRLFAARTAIALASQGAIALEEDLRQQLLDVVDSPFEPLAQDPLEDGGRQKMNSRKETPEDDRYFFGIDFGPYWLAPLGRCFGLGQHEIEQATLMAVRNDLAYKGSRPWRDDERARRRLYRHEETTHSHGSSPRVDDYGFYISYHAMFITAGRLLASTPLVKSANDWEGDRFPAWLVGHDISRRDGRWVSDRRDPEPVSQLTLLEEDGKTSWLGSISAMDFENALHFAPGYLTVWGRWSDLDAAREQSISVHTALVSRERSGSLLRALQTTADPHDFQIPSADDDLEIDDGPYRLKGWIIDQPVESGIDENDAWAGRVRYPAPEPALFVVESMRLSADPDRRIWSGPLSQELVLRSETWGYFPELRSSFEQPSGRRLQASLQFITSFLSAVGMDLVVEVEIQRRSRYRSFSNGDDNEPGNMPPSNRIFIVKSDGTIRTH